MTMEGLQSLKDLIGFKVIDVEKWDGGLLRITATRVDYQYNVHKRVFFARDVEPLAVEVRPTDPSASAPPPSGPSLESAGPTGS